MISVFDMFKVGVGPSSSHTVGPMKAGKQFIDDLIEQGKFDAVATLMWSRLCMWMCMALSQ